MSSANLPPVLFQICREAQHSDEFIFDNMNVGQSWIILDLTVANCGNQDNTFLGTRRGVGQSEGRIKVGCKHKKLTLFSGYDLIPIRAVMVI